MNNNSQPQPKPAFSIEGWVARDGFYSDPAESRLNFFINKPERVGSDRVQKWTALGFRMKLPHHCFPQLRWSHEPIQIRLQLWRID